MIHAVTDGAIGRWPRLFREVALDRKELALDFVAEALAGLPVKAPRPKEITRVAPEHIDGAGRVHRSRRGREAARSGGNLKCDDQGDHRTQYVEGATAPRCEALRAATSDTPDCWSRRSACRVPLRPFSHRESRAVGVDRAEALAPTPA